MSMNYLLYKKKYTSGTPRLNSNFFKNQRKLEEYSISEFEV
jgi:hypothetical protein